MHCVSHRAFLLWTFGWILALSPVLGAVQPAGLQVNYQACPLGMDDPRPRFSWHLESVPGARGEVQESYRIEVKGPGDRVVWDSHRIHQATSVGIPFDGPALKPSTRYHWTVTVWDAHQASSTAHSWFETGLMDPSLSAWEGATWLGAGPDDRVLCAHYLPVFGLRYTIALKPGSTRASFQWAGNDPRLLDRNLNAANLQGQPGHVGFRLELDITDLGAAPGGQAWVHLYREGYASGDDPNRPLCSLPVPAGVVTPSNRCQPHAILIRSEFGRLGIQLDGVLLRAAGGNFGSPWEDTSWVSAVMNPNGIGGDCITYGMLGEMGFAVPAGNEAVFSGIEVFNLRSPNRRLFSGDARGWLEAISRELQASGDLVADHGRFTVRGGTKGLAVFGDPSRNGMPMLRRAFKVSSPVTRARLFITARGLYEIHLNGQRVGQDALTPGLSQYDQTHYYQTYDVTGLIRPGANAMGAELGEGWWAGQLSYGNVWNHFGDCPALLAKLVLEHADGTRQVVATREGEWKATVEGPLRYASLNMGQITDATRESAVVGWAEPDFDDRGWKPAQAVRLEDSACRDGGLDFSKTRLVGQVGNPAGTYQVLPARSVEEVRPGVFVYDFGQNLVGVARVRFRKGKLGRCVTVRHAEMRYPDRPESKDNAGMLMTENLRAALAQDLYIQRQGDQVFQPSFTLHGFRYLEVSGVEEAPALEDVQGVVISCIQTLASGFECSNPRVNQLWSNIVWSNVDNFTSVPTDCPQRNERMGWSGDISVFSRTATYVSQADPFLRRHLQAMRDTQSKEGRFTDVAPVGGGFGGLLWGSAGVVLPWECYRQYGDVAILEEHYDAMVRYVRYLDTTLDDSGFCRDTALGDWLSPMNESLPPKVLAAAYHAYDWAILVQVAKRLGRKADAEAFRLRFEDRKAFFNRACLIAFGKGQTGPAVALALELVDATHQSEVIKQLIASLEGSLPDDRGVMRPPHSLMTGFIGTAWISDALSRMGRSDLAYLQLQNRTYPSWLYSVDQGATTIWERLNGYTVEQGFGGNNGMNSFNHYSFGAVGQWLISHSLGIARGPEGFQPFELRPEPDPTGGMTWAKGHYDSAWGRIESGWSLTKEGLTYTATVPANTTARLFLPSARVQEIREGGRPIQGRPGIRFLGMQDGKATFELMSGTYRFDLP